MTQSPWRHPSTASTTASGWPPGVSDNIKPAPAKPGGAFCGSTISLLRNCADAWDEPQSQLRELTLSGIFALRVSTSWVRQRSRLSSSHLQQPHLPLFLCVVIIEMHSAALARSFASASTWLFHEVLWSVTLGL